MPELRVMMLTSEYPPRIGGVATHVAELSRALRDLGLEISVVAPRWPGSVSGPGLDGLPVTRHSPLITAQPFSDWLLARWCRAEVRARGVDLLHVHGLRPLAGALATGLPVIFTNHTSGFLKTLARGGARLRRVARRLAGCAAILAPSEELAAGTRQAGYPGPVHYLPNGVDADRFAPGPEAGWRARWGLAADEVAVVLARRLVAKNGVVVAARALREVTAKVRMIFVGEGPERGVIEATLTAEGTASRALLAGDTPNDQMPGIYRAADFCVLPSLMEATSIAGLEAMASGRALIGSAVGGIPALIAHEQTGLLVPPADPAALARAIDRLAHDAPLRQQLGANARASVLRDFTWQRIAEQTSEVYRQVLATSAQRR